jgi:hypothetical protein
MSSYFQENNSAFNSTVLSINILTTIVFFYGDFRKKYSKICCHFFEMGQPLHQNDAYGLIFCHFYHEKILLAYPKKNYLLRYTPPF